MLSRCFNAHINVEYYRSVKAIKYIFKYINKGSHRATFSVNSENDEIPNYLNGRYIYVLLKHFGEFLILKSMIEI